MRPPNRESVPEIQPPTPTAEQPSPPPTFHAEPSYPVLKDAWPAAKPFALNGWFERHSFAPWLSVLLVLISAFLLLNLIGAVVMAMAVIPAAMESGGQISPEELLAAILEDAQVLLGANAVALVFGMGLVALLAARMTSRDWKSFLRIRRPDLLGMGLAAVGWAVLLPVLLWTSQLNSGLPLPQWLVDLEQAQTDMLEGALLGSNVSALFLLATVALAPAICEELMFRGYIQRQVERNSGVVWSIVGVGLLFGLFHLRLSQALPLSLLGMYLGYVTWVSGSIWTASVVHLLHNGMQVLVAVRVREEGQAAIDVVEDATVAWSLALLSLLLLVGVCMLLKRRREAVVGDAQDAVPVVSDPLISPSTLAPT